MIRVGIAGLGFMGMTHYHALKKVRGARVAALCTRDPKKLKGDWRSIQGNFGPRGGQENLAKVRTYTDLDAMLADPHLDLIDITLPTDRHLDVTLAAFKAGKDVLVEKPIAIELAEGKRMMAAARKSGRRLLVAHVLPFFPEYAAALALVRSGKYGALLGAHFKRIISKPDWGTHSARKKGAPDNGGPVIDLHIHDAHYMLALLGRPTAVYATGIEAAGAVQYISAQWDYPKKKMTVSATSGAVAARGRPFTHGFEIYLEKASLFFEWSTLGGKPTAVQPLTLATADGKAKPVKVKGGDPSEAFKAELAYAVEALAGKHDGELLSGDKALDALTLCHREIESVRRGRPVKV